MKSPCEIVFCEIPEGPYIRKRIPIKSNLGTRFLQRKSLPKADRSQEMLSVLQKIGTASLPENSIHSDLLRKSSISRRFRGSRRSMNSETSPLCLDIRTKTPPSCSWTSGETDTRQLLEKSEHPTFGSNRSTERTLFPKGKISTYTTAERNNSNAS